jgi:hypothetical protein
LNLKFWTLNLIDRNFHAGSVRSAGGSRIKAYFVRAVLSTPQWGKWGGQLLTFMTPFRLSHQPLGNHPVSIHDALDAPPGTSSSLNSAALRDSSSNACGPNDMG